MKLLQEIRFLSISTLIFMLISMFSVSYLFFYSSATNHFGNKDEQNDSLSLQTVTLTTDQEKGKILFRQKCAVCHSVTDQKINGPGLKNIMDRINEEQLISWVQNSTETRKKDKYFQKLFEENNETVMPAFQLTKEEILSIIDYVNAGNQKEAVAMVE